MTQAPPPKTTRHQIRYDYSLLTDDDLYLFNEGSHLDLYRKLGSHVVTDGDTTGTYFAVWAPDAEQVFVTGDFNEWGQEPHPLQPLRESGIWHGLIAGVNKGTLYKYHVVSRYDGYRVNKMDPFGVYHEAPPKTASVVWDLDYGWNDADWMANRWRNNSLRAPVSTYEVHLGSWMRTPDNEPLTYRDIGPKLAQYASEMGYTHVELLPIMEHPFYGSWGYQTTGYFAPTARYGSPQDFMFLVDCLHQKGVGLILDWVPSHFPTDEHGPGYFDGTHLYEHSSPQKGFHPDWSSYIFNYGRNEVRSFLLSSAMFWLDVYHADGLRVDAVASMLYLDYSRKQGEWIPNIYGGKENLEAISLLRRLNQEIYGRHPDVQTIAEESTAWPMVSRPIYVGGLGFGMKWDMGWMHDTLVYSSRDPIHRRFHHNLLTFRLIYAFNENFVLPLSHDEVVYGKGSLIRKMPGDDWQKFANLRALFGYMYGQPAKKLLFMGADFGQWNEWNHENGLDWHLLELPFHSGLNNWVADLNKVYREEQALHELDFDPAGFEWVDCNDADNSVVSFLRKAQSNSSVFLVVCNFTPVPRENYAVGVPRGGFWQEVLNSDSVYYGGSGMGNAGGVQASDQPFHGRPYSLRVTVPPLCVVFFRSAE